MSAPQPTGQVAVLLDYPLRLWERQQQYSDGVLREFELLVSGEASGVLEHEPPGQLLALAEMFTRNFGPLLDAIYEEREQALAQGQDRVDSHIPLVQGAPELLEQVAVVLARVDAYCQSAELLTLPREPWMVELADWTHEQLVTQYNGGEPTPWPGPFHVPA
jgi:hypothetical protein